MGGKLVSGRSMFTAKEWSAVEWSEAEWSETERKSEKDRRLGGVRPCFEGVLLLRWDSARITRDADQPSHPLTGGGVSVAHPDNKRYRRQALTAATGAFDRRPIITKRGASR